MIQFTDLALYLLIVAAIGIGWFLGRMETKRQKPRSINIPSIDYLLAENSGQILDRLLEEIDISGEAVEMHINLGILFRNKGELEKAIRVHQNLFARPNLKKQQSNSIQLELATDFLKAGLLDRAEKLLSELVPAKSDVGAQAVSRLVELYEEEQEWQSALDLQKYLPRNSDPRILSRLAYCACELAVAAMNQERFLDASKQIKHALKLDVKCARANILAARIAAGAGEHREAVRCFHKALEQDPKLFQKAGGELIRSYKSLGDQRGLLSFLEKNWENQPSDSSMLSLIKELNNQKGNERAVAEIIDKLIKVPSVAGFHLMVKLLVESGSDVSIKQLQLLERMLDQVDKPQHTYKCTNCGFIGVQHHWRCPSCKTWGKIYPNRLSLDDAN